MGLSKGQTGKTEILRETVQRDLRCILEAASFFRRVQVLVPASPQVFVKEFDLTAGILFEDGQPDSVITTSEMAVRYFGHDKTYKLPPFYPSNQSKPFRLWPGQCLLAQAQADYAIITLIVEPTHPPHDGGSQP